MNCRSTVSDDNSTATFTPEAIDIPQTTGTAQATDEAIRRTHRWPALRTLTRCLLPGLLCILPAATTAQALNAAGEDTLAETVSDTVRVREGYRFDDPLPATAPSAESEPASSARRTDPATPGSAGLPVPGEQAPAAGSHFRDSAWVSALRVELSGDRDGDGYYRGFRLDFDVDTNAVGADVYAVIYLQRNGFRPQALHTTQSFYIAGTQRADEYSLEIELLDDYRAGRYDLGIDIVDAYDGLLLDAVSPNEFTSLSALPLEAPDGHYNGIHDDYPQNDDTVGVAYAASSGFGLLLAVSLALYCRLRHHAVYSGRVAGRLPRLATRRRGAAPCRDISKRTRARSTRRKISGCR